LLALDEGTENFPIFTAPFPEKTGEVITINKFAMKISGEAGDGTNMSNDERIHFHSGDLDEFHTDKLLAYAQCIHLSTKPIRSGVRRVRPSLLTHRHFPDKMARQLFGFSVKYGNRTPKIKQTKL
jgi:hypothetical protein